MRYKDAVFGLCLGFLRNRADAEDITQDAFVRAYLNLRRYNLERKFSTWVFTIAANLCRNRLRYRRNHPVMEVDYEFEGGGTRPELSPASSGKSACARRSTHRRTISDAARLSSTTTCRTKRSGTSWPFRRTAKTRIHRGKAMLKLDKERESA
jgi:RNA polymerase sigma factor (sigma-70 family)